MKSRSALVVLSFVLCIWSGVNFALDAEQCAAHLRVIAASYEKTRQIPQFRPTGSTGGYYGINQLAVWGTPSTLVNGRFMDFARSNWYDPNSFYIGVANHPKEGNFHFYLIASDLRLDGQPGPTNLRQGDSGLPPMATNGVLFKIGANPAIIRALRARMMATQTTVCKNCAEPVRQILGDIGIKITATQTGRPFASATALAGNLMLGQITLGGQGLPVSVLATNEAEMQRFLKYAIDVDTTAKLLLEGRAK